MSGGSEDRDRDAVEGTVRLHFTWCDACASLTIAGSQFDQNLLIMRDGIGHLRVAPDRPLCEEPSR